MKKKPKSLKELQKEWYAKLKKTGFKDIENSRQELNELQTGWFTRKRESLVMWEAKQEYYYMATQFLTANKFKSELDRIIWEYHSNGISVRNISKLLKEAGFKRMGRTKVWRHLDTMREKMKRMFYARPRKHLEQ